MAAVVVKQSPMSVDYNEFLGLHQSGSVGRHERSRVLSRSSRQSALRRGSSIHGSGYVCVQLCSTVDCDFIVTTNPHRAISLHHWDDESGPGGKIVLVR